MLSSYSSGAGRRATRKADRQRQILDIAERSFFEHGFAATSMSAIAAEVGGSKTTLWTHFASKEALFEALLDQRVSSFVSALSEALFTGSTMEETLTRFGRVFLERILDEDACALRRLIAAEGVRFPAIAQAYFDRGPRHTVDRLARYMAERMEDGEIRTGDPILAARQFMALCKAGSFFDQIWLRPDAPVPDPANDVEKAVVTFLRAWRSPSPAAVEGCSAPA